MVERPKVSLNEMIQYGHHSNIAIEETASIDWVQITAIGYAIIAVILFVKILAHFVSLFKLLHKKEVIKKERFSLVDLDEDIAPFSFFNYIVYNSSYYTNDELHSILSHEKIHSREKHSIDIILAKFFCIIFWFNPFMWLYKKAIAQNLEYIADQKAIQHIKDKKVYQKALLKVVSHQSCLSITNNFYQSLIKKRIVMLNKNQSKKSSSWKYVLVIPALVAFVIFFQVKVIAQEKPIPPTPAETKNTTVVEIIVNKNTTDEEMGKDCKMLKNDFGVVLSFSKIKRNSDGEITAINASFNDNKGSKGTHNVDGDEPIPPLKFSLKRDKNGRGEIGFYDTTLISENREIVADNSDFSTPTPPTPPTPPDFPYDDIMSAPNAPALPEFPEAPEFPSDINNKKAMAQYEKSMASFEKKMKVTEEEFENKMSIFEKGLSSNDPKMKNFEKEMEKFEIEMEKYQAQLEENIEKNQANKGEMFQKEAKMAREEAMKAREEAMKERKEAMKEREEAMKAREEAIKMRNQKK